MSAYTATRPSHRYGETNGFSYVTQPAPSGPAGFASGDDRAALLDPMSSLPNQASPRANGVEYHSWTSTMTPASTAATAAPIHQHGGPASYEYTNGSQIPPAEASSAGAKRKRENPDWDSFYRNGLPTEVIVIEDTPEAEVTQPNGHDSTNGTWQDKPAETPYQLAHSASSLSRKRKHEDEAAQNQALLDQSRARNVLLENPRVNTKKKRVRGPELAELNSLDLWPDHGYRGLEGPVVRSKRDVHLRAGSLDGLDHTVKVNDDDGHYIVVPNAKITWQYQIRKLLGQGTFGKVVQAVDMRHKDAVAVKVIRSVQKYRDAAKIELRVLQCLRKNDPFNQHRCIHLRDCFEFRGHTCLVMDLLDSSLFDFLKANSFVPFPNSHIQSFARQLLTSVAFLHDLGLVHTDLKPENVLLTNADYQVFTYNRHVPTARHVPPRQPLQRKVIFEPDIRLIDFGSATFEDEYHSSVVSTRHYRAPEIILGLGWSFPCDIWSIACILVEFWTGDALFQTHNNLEHLAIMEQVFGKRIDPDLVRQLNKRASKGSTAKEASSYFKRLKLSWPASDTTRASIKFVHSMKRLEEIIPQTTPWFRNFYDLLKKMFVYDPKHRITAKEALKHPWFRESIRDDGTEAAKIAIERGLRPMPDMKPD